MGSSVGAGSKHTVFNYGNQLRCVGANNRGQLGAGNTNYYADYAIVTGLENISWVSAGTDFSGCIAKDLTSSKNVVYMWGANKYGQLGDGTIKDKWSPVKVNIPVEEEEAPLKISAGANHTLCATETRIYAWGCNRSGQLGNGGVEDSRYPSEVSIPSEYAGQPVRYISAGTNFSACVIGNDILVWGDNTYGQLGTGDFAKRTAPVLLQWPELPPEYDGLEKLPLSVAVSAGGGHLLCCAFYKDTDANFYTEGIALFLGCGRNDYGQLGLGHTNTVNELAVIEHYIYNELSRIMYDVILCVGAGGLHSVFMIGRHAVGSSPEHKVDSYAVIRAFGCGRWGQNGDSGRSSRVTPQPVTGKHSFHPEMWNVRHYNGRSYITAGGSHSIVNAFYPPCAWGDNSMCQLGTGEPTGDITAGNVYETYPVAVDISAASSNPITFYGDPASTRINRLKWHCNTPEFFSKDFSKLYTAEYDPDRPHVAEGLSAEAFRRMPKYVMTKGGGNFTARAYYRSFMIELPDFMPDFDIVCLYPGNSTGIVEGKSYMWAGTGLATPVTELIGEAPANAEYICSTADSIFVISEGKAHASGPGRDSLGIGVTDPSLHYPFTLCDITHIGMDSIVKVVSIGYTTCFLSESGVLYTCGFNTGGSLGQGGSVPQGGGISTPTPIAAGDIESGDRVIDVVCGLDFFVCRTESGKLYGWGNNTHAQYTHSPGICASYNEVPKLIRTSGTVKLLCAGHLNTVVVYEEHNGVFACGSNANNRLNFIPESTRVDTLVRTGLGDSEKIKDIMHGGDYIYCINEYNEVLLVNGAEYDNGIIAKKFLNITGSSTAMHFLDYRNNIRQGHDAAFLDFKFPSSEE